jgi:hypothetical protein
MAITKLNWTVVTPPIEARPFAVTAYFVPDDNADIREILPRVVGTTYYIQKLHCSMQAGNDSELILGIGTTGLMSSQRFMLIFNDHNGKLDIDWGDKALNVGKSMGFVIKQELNQGPTSVYVEGVQT